TLAELISKTGAIPEPIIGAILVQLVTIVDRLHHQLACVHNDLDARNIFICKASGIVRVGGFFFSHFLSCEPASEFRDDQQSSRRFLGPLRHQAPERMLGLECHFPSDVWSLGFLVREMALGEFPLSLLNTKWRNKCERFSKTARPEDFGHQLSELVSSCMNKNPRLRPNTRQLLLHPFL
ncbi:hypothetical protein GUITHDRAFT_54988, partial [Guillardia theta CCMP2712]